MKNKKPFSFDADGLAHISGPLTLDTVAEVFAEAGKAMAGGLKLSEVDLGEVQRVDSSGLALLLEWQSVAKREGSSVVFRNAPSDLHSLARLCETEDLLTLEQGSGSAAMTAEPADQTEVL
ncbi:MAG TPA: STAS domain-containing protein [Xanthomonadales bacterium]|nr:STAS domain-containing protein [Xanthomonadales bacterium]